MSQLVASDLAGILSRDQGFFLKPRDDEGERSAAKDIIY